MRGSTPYSPSFIETCFITWYKHPERPVTYYAMSKIMPKDEYGRQPSISSVKKWYLDSWARRADELDSKAIQIIDNDLIYQKVQMLQRQAEYGATLQHLGMNYLISGSFDSAASAVQAVIRGAELERQSRGIGEIHARMVKMTDAELEADIIKDIIRASNAGQIIEGEEVEDETGGSDNETPE